MKNEFDRIGAVEYFSEVANKYDEEIHLKSLGTKYLSFIETNFVKKCLQKFENNKAEQILEIGAGTGRFTSLLLNCCNKVEIIEAAPGMVEILEKKFEGHNININNVNASEKFPYASDYFNCVLSMRVLKYIPKWKETISEVSRTLKDDGCFIFSISNLYSVAYFRVKANKYFLFKPKDVIAHLKSLNFDIVNISTTSRLPFPIYCKINSKWVLSMVIFLENILDKVLPYWLFPRAIFICAQKKHNK